MTLFQVDSYDVGLALVGAAALTAVLAPRVFSRTRVSYPLLYLALGVLLFWVPLPVQVPDLRADALLAERLTELTLIIALMGVGLKIDRPFGWRSWSSTWRLLAVTMPLTIAAAALLGWWVAGLAPAAAMLLGAVSAPTDPVLASEVQSGEPLQSESEDEVRFSLTSEAGFNDGLAFPFTYAAIAAATAAAPSEWLGQWLAIAVVFKIVVGILVGLAVGRLIAAIVFDLTVGDSAVARSAEGLMVIAATLLVYALAELAQGYGFLAVFVAGLTIRQYERDHDYHIVLHRFAHQAEQLAIAVVLVLLGGMVADGLFADLTWQQAVVALVIAFVLRPAFGLLAMLGRRGHGWRSRLIVAVFGIKGIGSLYYLSYGLEHGNFPQVDELWTLVAAVVVASIVVHGLTATAVMRHFDRWRREVAPYEERQPPRHCEPHDGAEAA